MDHFIGVSFPYAQPDEVRVPEDVVVENVVSTDRRTRKRDRMMKELASLNEDNAGKSEKDRIAIWRKLQKYISRNDDIANEYVNILLFHIH